MTSSRIPTKVGGILTMNEEQLERTLEEARNARDRWKVAFGWTLFAAIVVFVSLVIVGASGRKTEIVKVGYEPEQVTDVALHIYRELCHNQTPIVFNQYIIPEKVFDYLNLSEAKAENGIPPKPKGSGILPTII